VFRDGNAEFFELHACMMTMESSLKCCSSILHVGIFAEKRCEVDRSQHCRGRCELIFILTWCELGGVVYAIKPVPRTSIESPMPPSINALLPVVRVRFLFSSAADYAYATRVEAVALSYLQVGGRTPTVL
jgi:hypothetical protein